MAAEAFPVAKLGMQLLKQVSKPIANSFAKRAKSSPIFKDYVCIPVAQLFHWYDVKVRMRILNLGKVTAVPKLNEEKAIETGSQILSEFIIISIISSAIIFEFARQAEKEEAKQALEEQAKAELKARITGLEMAVEQNSAQIKEVTRLSYSLLEQLHKGSIKGLFTKPPPLPKELETAASGPVNMSLENVNATKADESLNSLPVTEVNFSSELSIKTSEHPWTTSSKSEKCDSA